MEETTGAWIGAAAVNLAADKIRVALERNDRVVSQRPSVGQGTAVTRVSIRDGLTCDVEDGPWKLQVGMTDKYGGENAGPNPGVLGRAALGSCLAMGYVMWAARRGVPIRGLTVEVEADYDVRGELGVDDSISPAYSAVRLVVTVESDSPERDVCEVLREAERYSSYWNLFREGVPVVRETWFARTGGTAPVSACEEV